MVIAVQHGGKVVTRQKHKACEERMGKCTNVVAKADKEQTRPESFVAIDFVRESRVRFRWWKRLALECKQGREYLFGVNENLAHLIARNTFINSPGINRSNKAMKPSQYIQILNASRLNKLVKSNSVNS